MWRSTPNTPFWFQVYTLKDDDFMQRLFDRAKAAGCDHGGDHCRFANAGTAPQGSEKRRLSAPPKLTVKSVANMMTKVQWGLGMLGTKRRFFGNIVGHAKGVEDPSSLATWTAEAFDPSLDWDPDPPVPQDVGWQADHQGHHGTG